MAAEKGRLFILAVETTPASGTYTDIGSAISNSFTINNEQVDITDKDSAGWKELLSGAGEQSISMSLSGVFKSQAGEAIMKAAAEANAILKYQMTRGSDTITGDFAITSYENTGDKNGAVTYSASFESSGTQTFA